MRQKGLKASLALAGMTLVSAAASVLRPARRALIHAQYAIFSATIPLIAAFGEHAGSRKVASGSAVLSITVGRHFIRGWTDAQAKHSPCRGGRWPPMLRGVAVTSGLSAAAHLRPQRRMGRRSPANRERILNVGIDKPRRLALARGSPAIGRRGDTAPPTC
jgi:hypothetical protein